MKRVSFRLLCIISELRRGMNGVTGLLMGEDFDGLREGVRWPGCESNYIRRTQSIQA